MKVVVKRTSKKTLKICPQGDGSITVVAYRFLSQNVIAQHIAENIQWINSCLEKLSQTSVADTRTNNLLGDSAVTKDFQAVGQTLDSNLVKDIFAGRCIMLCGQVYRCCSSLQQQTHLKDDLLCICEKLFATKESRLKAIASFLKRMSTSTLSQQVSKIGSEMALCPSKIQFKDLHGRWCSCTDAETRAIVLDYRLIQLPKQLQTFVIAHTFAHFKVANHGKEFLQVLTSYFPNQKECASEISQYSFLLDV